MERLTKIDGCGQNDLIRCFDCGPEKAGENLENCGYCSEGWQRALNRLAAYEDTGLSQKVCGEYKKFEDEAIGKNVTFNRIVELMNADAAGRLVVLPCKELFEKIGDDVYVIDDGEVVEALLCLVGFDHTGTDCIEAVYGKSQEDEQWYTLRFADVGKTVFLTREEAEAALAGEGGKHETD